MNLDQYLRKKEIKKQAKEAAKQSVKEIVHELNAGILCKLRDEFEKTLGAEMQLHESVLGWHEGAYTNQYTQCLFKGFCVAWHHRQGEVDALQKRVDELETAFKHLIEMNNKSISYEHDLFDKGWNQCAERMIENIYRLTGLDEQALKGGEE